ncbi:hypothetical protein I6A84_09520 [Frankia sp. CNm7]|uniref:Uncharacterized protein n=1 Tax=Frankia nepalensis TaxID=1836974 RepID=A0A937RJX1_9ACTN|nr:hypothetical protein [Frankia nepalensis]MBL7512851.1 hypothetical protein [Frankia nepalensis]MBL7518344.1 hypothetical protein [Frankia nepalensis]MBL7630214.1 hypothetical protein [Frankia nepalensis]
MPAPRSGVLTGWGNAWLAGFVGSDDVLTRVQQAIGPGQHTIDGQPLLLGLGALRAARAERFRLVMPVPGDVSGLPGPPAVNGDALAAGEAVIVIGPNPPLLLVPSVEVHGPAVEGVLESVHWRVLPAARVPAPPSPVPAAEHELSDAIRRTTSTLLDLDIASARPEVLALLRDRGDAEPGPGLGPGYPPAAHALLARAERLRALLDLAALDDGAAVTAGEIGRRTAALRGLSAAVRRSYEAAYDAFDPSHATSPPSR